MLLLLRTNPISCRPFRQLLATTSIHRNLVTDIRSGGGSLLSLKYEVSSCAVQGGRSYMEDEHFQTPSGDFLAVFDGHGGRAVARYLRQNLYANVISCLPSTAANTNNNNGDTATTIDNEEITLFAQQQQHHPSLDDHENALRKALDKVDREVQRVSHWSFQGCTAVALWIYHAAVDTATTDPQRRTVLTANIGDSRAVLSRNRTALDLTIDHKPNSPKEKARIEARGGKVVWSGRVDKRGRPIESQGVYRVNGNLALSRAMGDRSERPAVTADPDISRMDLREDDDFIVIATDGLWDVMSSQDVVSYIHALLLEKSSSDCKALHNKMANLLVAEALKRGTMDNVTIVILWLNPIQ